MKQSSLAVLGACLAGLILARSGPAQHVVVEGEIAVTHGDAYRTTARVSYPGGPPPLQGWPLVVVVPGLGSSHLSFAPEADAIAGAGYFVVTYDVRGQASAKALNPGRGSRLWALDEWIDLAEVIEWATQSWPDAVDSTRIGVVGDSQGGVHAWAAAAYSGKVLPSNPRRSTPFPVIRAVIPRIMAPQTVDVLVPHGTGFHELFGSWLDDAKEEIVRFDPEFRRRASEFFENDDPAGLAAWMKAEAGRDFVGELATSRVPVLCMMTWLDEFLSPDLAIAALDMLPKETPRRLFVSTGFHSTPLNTYQVILRQRLGLRWLNWFLRDDNKVGDGGPPVITAAIPGDPLQYSLVQSIWRLREDGRYPSLDAQALRFDLDAFLRLRSANEDVFVGQRRLVNALNVDYDWRDFARDRSQMGRVAAALPRDKLDFVGPVLPGGIELVGDGVLYLRLKPSRPDFQLGVRLFSQLSDGSRQVLAVGGQTWRNASVASAVYRIPLGCSTAVLPVGSRLVLEVSNQVVQRPGTEDRFRLQPLMQSFHVDLDFDATRTARLELPLRGSPRPDLGTGIFDIEVDRPLAADMFLQSSVSRAGVPYLVLLSLTPPTYNAVSGGRDFWFARDNFTDFAFQFAASPLFPGFVGLTDASGVARPSLRFDRLQQLPPELRGLDMWALPILLPGPVIEAGASVVVRFR